jgi:hypothetical protein
MKLSLNHRTLPMIDLGTYGSIFEPEFDQVHYNVVEEDGKSQDDFYKLIDTFDSKLYMELLAKSSLNTVTEIIGEMNELLDDKGLSELKMTIVDDSLSLWSPQFYNFESDVLYYNVEVSDDAIDKVKLAIKDNLEFSKWLHHRHRSYDGYICFLPQDVDTWIDQSDDAEIFGKFVAFLTKDLFTDDEMHDHEYSVYEYMSGNGVIDDCLDYSVIDNP